jgi:hypothetical protein
MSWTTDQYVTAAAVLLLVLSVPLTFQIADARTDQTATDHSQTTTVAQATSRQTTNDFDGDGIPDSTDRCPKQPETKNGYRDGDGCPDTVATTSAS